MQLAVSCPHCGHVCQLNEKDASQKAKCPECGGALYLSPRDTVLEIPCHPPTHTFPLTDSVPEELNEGDEVLETYRVETVLGEGLLGRTYRVHHLKWGIDLVLKTPRSAVLAQTGARDTIIREASTWAGMGFDAHMAGCYYVRVIGGIPRIFIEYVEGTQVAACVRDQRLYRNGPEKALEQVFDIAIQAAWGIHFVHEHGSLHQNIQPANLLLSPEGTIKVSDPGLIRALWTGRDQMGSQDPQKPLDLPPPSPYFAPEQAKALAQNLQENPLERKIRVTRSADVWSWALCVLEMLCGRLPPELDAEPTRLLQSCIEITRHEEALPDIPTELAGLLERCLAVNAEERPQDLGEVAENLCRLYQTATRKPYTRKRQVLAEVVADGLNNQAMAALDLGEQSRVAALLERALIADPHHLHANYNQGLIKWRAGELTDDALVRQMRRVRAECEDQWEDEYLLGWIHLERGDGEAAGQVFQEARKQVGDDFHAQERIERVQAMVKPGTRCLHKLQGHEGDVLSVSFSPDGRLAISTGADASIRIWDVSTGKSRQILWDDDKVGGGVLTADGSLALTFTVDGRSMQLWETLAGQRLHLLRGHSGRIRSVTIGLDGVTAVSAGEDRTVRVWDVHSGACQRTMEGHTADVRCVAYASSAQRAVTASLDKTLRIWDVVTGQCTGVLEGHTEAVWCVGISKNGRWAVSASTDKTLRVWDLEAAVCTRTLTGHSAAVKGVALTAGGTVAVSVSRDDTLRVWNVETGRNVHTVGAFGASNIDITPEGDKAITGHFGEFRIWELERTPQVAPIAVVPPRRNAEALLNQRAFKDAMDRARYARDCEYWGTAANELAAARSIHGYDRAPEALTLWDQVSIHMGRGALRDVWVSRVFKNHSSELADVAVTPDGQYTLSLDSSGVLHAWETGTGRTLWTRKDLMPAAGLAVSPDGRLFICAARDGALRVRNIQSGRSEQFLGGLRERITAVALNASNELLVCACGEDIAPMLRVVKVGARHFMHQLQGHDGEITDMGLSADGRLAVTSSADATLRIWDLYSGRRTGLLEGHQGKVSSVALTPDGRTAVSGGDDGRVRVWDIQASLCVRTLETEEDPITDVALTPDGRFAVAGATSGALRLFDLAAGKCVRKVGGHLGAVVTVAISWDAKIVVSGGVDRIVRSWQLDWELKQNDPVDWDEQARPWLRVFLACRTSVGDKERPGLNAAQYGVEDLDHLRRFLQWGGFGWFRFDAVERELNLVATTESARLRGAINRRNQAQKSLERARDAIGRGDWENATAALLTVRSMPEYERATEFLDEWAKVCQHSWCGRLRQVWEHRRVVARDMYAVVMSPDARFAMSGGFDGRVMLWDLSSGRALRELHFPNDEPSEHVAGLYISPDSRWAAAVGDHGGICIWEMSTGNARFVQRLRVGRVTAACFATGGRVAILGSEGGTIDVLDVPAGRRLRTFKRQSLPIESIATTPNASLVVAACGDRQVEVWDTKTSQSLGTWPAHEAFVTSLTLSMEGGALISTSLDKTVCAWNTRTGRKLRALEGHGDVVRSADITSDGRVAISASSDMTLRLWDLREGTCLHVIEGAEGHHHRVRSVSMSPDGQRAASVSTDGTLRVWYLDWERESADQTLNLWYRSA